VITALVMVLFIDMTTGAHHTGNMVIASPYLLRSCIVEVRKLVRTVDQKLECTTVSGLTVEWEVTGEYKI
jgi:uncharacterized protein (DUF305 family)